MCHPHRVMCLPPIRPPGRNGIAVGSRSRVRSHRPKPNADGSSQQLTPTAPGSAGSPLCRKAPSYHANYSGVPPSLFRLFRSIHSIPHFRFAGQGERGEREGERQPGRQGQKHSSSRFLSLPPPSLSLLPQGQGSRGSSRLTGSHRTRVRQQQQHPGLDETRPPRREATRNTSSLLPCSTTTAVP